MKMRSHTSVKILKSTKVYSTPSVLKVFFSLVHCNIRSISKNFDQFCVYLSEYSASFDVIVLSETWKIEDPSLYSLAGYNVIYCDGGVNKCDGVVMYLNKIYKYTHKSVKLGDVWSLVVEICFDNFTVDVLAAYRPPSTNVSEFICGLDAFLCGGSSGDYKMLVGDINIDILKNNDVSCEYLEMLSEKGYTSLISSPTRPQSSSCLDHIFFKSTMGKSISEMIPAVVESNLTDHYFTVVSLPGIKVKDDCCAKNNVAQVVNYSVLVDELEKANFNDLYTEQDPNKSFEFFIKTVKRCIEKATTIKKGNNRIKGRKPWITKQVLDAISLRDSLFQKTLKSRNDFSILEEYRAQRNYVNKIVKKTKARYYRDIIEANKKDTKKLWQEINKIMGKEKPAQCQVEYILNQGGKITNKLEISNYFNNYFCSVGADLASNVPITDATLFPVRGNFFSKNFFIFPIIESEIKFHISNLKTGKAPGNDNIKAEHLKVMSHIVVPHLCYIFNRCIESSVFPTALKCARVMVLHKKGVRCKVENYRNISLISVFGKLFELLLKDRIVSYLETCGILSGNQFGFRQGKCTLDALAKLTSYMYKAVDNSTPAICVFFDLARAFDTVCHEKLLHKLEHLGFRGRALELFRSYLTNRTQSVKVNGVESSPGVVGCGVPQGTVLGPLLFSIYINDLLFLNTPGKIISYADDTVVFYEGKTWDELKEIVESDLIHLKQWFDFSRLTVNFSKTFFLPVTSYESNLPRYTSLSICLGNDTMRIVSARSVRYLGVYIDSHLKWDVHIQNTHRTLRGVLFKIGLLVGILDIQHLMLVYKALFEAILRYGIVAWGGALETHIRPLRTVQNRILKMIMNKHRLYPTSKLYDEARVLNIRQLFALESLVIQRKHGRYHFIEHEYATRNRDNKLLILHKSSKSVGQRYFETYAVKLYNLIPREIREVKNSFAYKRKLFGWVLSNRDQIDAMF